MDTKLTEMKNRLDSFRENGYTIFENVYDKEIIESWIAKYHQLRESIYGDKEISGLVLISNIIERIPEMMLPVVSNPIILDFAEMVIGPFVQISDSVILSMNSVSQEEADHKVNGWHRDRYALVTRGGYQNPTALSVLCYLQDMTTETGPLRILPGSHRTGMLLKPEEVYLPHKDELVLSLKAGDVAFFHNAMLHTGTPNTSGTPRIFVGGSYNSTWMRHVDDHSGPNVQKLIEDAKARNDHRQMRLFGVDEQLEKRINSGFHTASDDIRWAEWAAADKAAIK